MPSCCLDAGHNLYGIDTGAEKYVKEQEITLDIVLRIKPLLEASGIKVVLTRSGDKVPGNYSTVTGSLQARCDIANNAKVDIFVSVHCNSGGGTGEEDYVVAHGGEAEKLANKLLSYLVPAGNWRNRGLKTANDYVLANTDMPAVLTENGFVDNLDDSNKLKDPNFRHALAIAHAKGICAYFNLPYLGDKKEATSKMKNLVIYFSKSDRPAAEYLSDFLRCPIILRDYFTADMSAQTNYAIGGPALNLAPATLLSGKDQYETLEAVLNFIKAHK